MKKLVFLLVIAVVTSPLLAQDLSEQKTEFEKVKAELGQLEKENENLIKQNTDLARELLILKEAMRGLLDETPQKSDSKEAADGILSAPKSIINGSVLVTNKATNKVVIRPGSNGGIEAGYKFQIIRDGRQTAVIEIEKVVERYAIGKVIFGEMDNIKADDEAISVMPKSTITTDVKAEKPVTETKVNSAPNPLAKIKGDLGNGRYVLSVGRADGLKEKDILMVSDNNKSGKATIQIEKLEDDFAVAKLLDGDSIEINDRVEIKQPSINNGLEGLVRIKNEKLIAIDIGTRKGAQVGQRFKITRDGKSVTEVILKELYDDWALVEPIDETKSSEIAVGDKVIELKSSSPQ